MRTHREINDKFIRLRPYRSSDAETIIKWAEDPETFYKWSAAVMGDYPLTAEQFDEVVRKRAEMDNFYPFSVLYKGILAGYLVLRVPGDDPDVLRFGFVIVNSKMRGYGFGKRMLQTAARYAFDIYHAKKVTLGVFTNNKNAYKLYRTLGFRETGEKEIYEIPGISWECVEMELDYATFVEKNK